MHRNYAYLGLWPLLAAFGGCSTLGTEVTDLERLEQVKGIDKHSTYPAMRRDAFERINLVEMIDPTGQAKTLSGPAWPTSKEPRNKSFGVLEPEDPETLAVKYDLTLAWFRQSMAGTDDRARRRVRNGVQERLLSVSISRCNVFKTFLRRDQANKGFLLGSLTTVASVLGAVLPGATASRNLAGTAGIFSGMRAEYNQAYYSNLAAHVIVKGIEARQEAVYRRIQSEGQAKSVDDYPLDAAIKDAVYFDGLCSVVVGLDQAAASVEATSEPGVDAAMRTIMRARLAQEAMSMPSSKLLDPKTLDSIGTAASRLGMSLVGSIRSDEKAPSLADDARVILSAFDGDETDAGQKLAAAAAQRFETLKKDKTPLANKDQAPPVSEDIGRAVVQQIKAKIREPLQLNVCITKDVEPALKARSEALAQTAAANAVVDPAGAKAEQAKAELAVVSADRQSQLAIGKLQLLLKLARIDIESYLSERIAAVNGDGDGSLLNSVEQLVGVAKNAASSGQGCK